MTAPTLDDIPIGHYASYNVKYKYWEILKEEYTGDPRMLTSHKDIPRYDPQWPDGVKKQLPFVVTDHINVGVKEQ